MTETMFNNRRPDGTRAAMHVKHRLERVLPNSEIYDIRVGGGCAVIEPPSLDARDMSAIRESVDLMVYYVREDGIYVHRSWRM